MTEAELVTAAAAGDERAFAQLLEPYRLQVLRLAAKWLHGDRDTAEDVWQDVQFRVFRNLHRFRPEKSFKSWVMTIAANMTKNELRNRKRHACVQSLDELAAVAGGENRLMALEDPSDLPDELVVDEELSARMAAVLHELPLIQRQTFVLRQAGESYEEIALHTHSTMGTVKSRLHRARAALHARLVA